MEGHRGWRMEDRVVIDKEEEKPKWGVAVVLDVVGRVPVLEENTHTIQIVVGRMKGCN